MALLCSDGVEEPPEGWTTAYELAKLWGCTPCAAAVRLLAWWEKGVVERKKYRSGNRGRKHMTYHYNIVKKQKLEHSKTS